MEDLEKIFQEDIKNKQMIRSGLRGRSGRLRKHEKVRLPSDRVKGFERKLIKSAGVLKISTISQVKAEEILSRIKKGEYIKLSEFEGLSFEDGQRVAAEYRRLHTNGEIAGELKVAGKAISQFFAKYQIAKMRNGTVLMGNSAMEYLDRRYKLNNSKETIQVFEGELMKPAKIMVVNVEQIFDNESLKGFVERLGLFLDVPNKKYRVTLQVEEA